jgi:hypothetical protein
MAERTYETGFADGWESVAGKEPMIGSITYPPARDTANYEAGFLYGRAEALIHFTPGTGTRDAEPTRL